MSYISLEEAMKMSRKALAIELIKTQTMAAAAVCEALTVGGYKSEQAIIERYEARLPVELRQTVGIMQD